jgi:hypothetical protein
MKFGSPWTDASPLPGVAGALPSSFSMIGRKMRKAITMIAVVNTRPTRV